MNPSIIFLAPLKHPVLATAAVCVPSNAVIKLLYLVMELRSGLTVAKYFASLNGLTSRKMPENDDVAR